MNFIKIWFLFLTGTHARDPINGEIYIKNKYAWNSYAYQGFKGEYVDLTPEVHLLLKEGLKIGYLPPTEYNCKFIHLTVTLFIKKLLLNYYFKPPTV